MPKTLNPNNAFPPNIPNFPISGANEPVAIEPLEAAIQAVLDRTENLHQSRLEVESTGVRRIRRVPDLTTLANLTGMNDGDTVDVDGLGRYRLYLPSGATPDGLWVVAASGGGRWVHMLNNMRGGPHRLATLNSDGRLAQDVRDGSIATAHIANGAVTAPKLASGAAVANIGYTPVNRAGDTMTGNLITTERVFVHRQLGTGSSHISLAIGDDDTGLNWGGDGAVQLRANGQELAFYNGNQMQFKPNKNLIFDPGGGQIVFAPHITETTARICMYSGYLGAPFTPNYGYTQFFLSNGSTQNHVSGFYAFYGESLGSNAAMHIHGRDGVLYFFTRPSIGNYTIYTHYNTIEMDSQLKISSSQIRVNGHLIPDSNNTYQLGNSQHRWASIWAANGTIQTSDIRLKTDIEDSPLGLEFIRALRPVRYRWKQGGQQVDPPQPRIEKDEDGKEIEIYDSPSTVRPIAGRRYHYGLIAQEVQAVLDRLGVGDFGGWVLDDVNDKESVQSLRYDEFIAPIISAIQQLADQVDSLKRQIKKGSTNQSSLDIQP